MREMSRALKIGALLALGATLAGCCVAPVRPYGPRYGGRVVYEPVPVVVTPVVVHRRWGWYR